MRKALLAAAFGVFVAVGCAAHSGHAWDGQLHHAQKVCHSAWVEVKNTSGTDWEVLCDRAK